MGFYLRKALRFGPLRVNLSQHGLGLSAGVTGARFGLDASGHPYVHAGRGGLYYRKRWPVPTPSSHTREADALPSGPPPPETHGVVGWGWVLAAAALFVWIAWLMGQ